MLLFLNPDPGIPPTLYSYTRLVELWVLGKEKSKTCNVGGAPGSELANTSLTYYAMRESSCPFKCLLTGGAARQLLMVTQLPEDVILLVISFVSFLHI